jgi:hypothetical protein
MSRYFKAEPYPDEEICSLLIRTVRKIGLSSPDFVRWYFNLSPIPLESMGNLIPHIAELVGCSPRRILQEHTLVPYGTAALPPEESRRLTIDLTSGRIPELSNPIGKLGLRWCEACVHFEIGEFGESYWHRSHILPGVSTCHLHGMPLMQWPAPYAITPIRKIATFWMDQKLPHELSGTSLRFPMAHSLLHQVSQMSHRALKERRSLQNAHSIPNDWRQVFDPGFIYFAGCSGSTIRNLPSTTSRILALISKRHLEKVSTGIQLELSL